MTYPNYTWDHVHIRTPDVEAMATWFADTLGAEIVRKPAMVIIQLGGGSIFLAEATSDVNPPPVTPYQGLEHIGLAVKDIDAVAASLKAKGVEFTKEPTTIRPGTRICFIAGPLGISVELLERDPKYQV
jgi:lactoylglutathione lyase